MKSTSLGRTVAAIAATAGIALGVPALGAGTAQAAPAPHAAAPVAHAATPAPVNITAVQTNLKKLGRYTGAITGRMNPGTVAAVKAYQKAHGWYPNGVVNARLAAYLASEARAAASALPKVIDRRCLTGGRVMCIDKTTRKLYYLVDNKLVLTADARFGRPTMQTREGVFHVYRMGRTWTSHEFGGSMPYAMFFSGGQAVHYSSDFARRGYAGASHGCVNIRDMHSIVYLFDHTHLGDKVVVYRAK